MYVLGQPPMALLVCVDISGKKKRGVFNKRLGCGPHDIECVAECVSTSHVWWRESECMRSLPEVLTSLFRVAVEKERRKKNLCQYLSKTPRE